MSKELQIKNDRARLLYISKQLKKLANLPTTSPLDKPYYTQMAKDLLDISSRICNVKNEPQ